MAAAHVIRGRDPGGSVTVLSAESDPPYYRPLIPFLISGKKSAKQMVLFGTGPYTGGDIVVETDSVVSAVDPEARAVSLEDGRRFGYEKILFATGSRPYVPPGIEGTDIDGVFALRTLADARKMARRAERTDQQARQRIARPRGRRVPERLQIPRDLRPKQPPRRLPRRADERPLRKCRPVPRSCPSRC